MAYEGWNATSAASPALFVVQPVCGPVSLQAEAAFLRTGGDADDFSDRLNPPPYRATLRYDYLTVPVFAKLTARRGSALQASVFAGPTFWFLLSCRHKRNDQASSTACEDLKNRIVQVYVPYPGPSGSMTGLVGGADVTVPLRRLRLVLDGRYTRTFGLAEEVPETKHQAVLVGLGVAYAF